MRGDRGARVLAVAELSRAIFIDYEGNKPAPGSTTAVPPTLLGYMVDGEVRAGIIASGCSSAAASAMRP
jgi:hypothetical protein